MTPPRDGVGMAPLFVLAGATVVGLLLLLCAAVVADWLWMHTLHALLGALT